MATGFLPVVVGLLAIQGCLAVDRANFKTCQQSSFCKRQRETQPGSSPWEVMLSSLNSTIHSLQVEIFNTRNQARLQLQLIALSDSTLRIQLDELNPPRPRHRVEKALQNEPELNTLEIAETSSDAILLKFGKTGKAVLLAKPFRLDVFDGDRLVISLNARGLLKFEHQRVRKTALRKAFAKVYEAVGSAPEKAASFFQRWLPWLSEEPPVAAPEEEPARDGQAIEAEIKGEVPAATSPEELKDAEDDLPDMWEETFKSHTDSKPYGPTSVGLDISFPGARHVYGIPEHADTFALKETKTTDPYRLYNFDVFEYELWNPMALYGSVPFMMAKSPESAVGVFWHNTAETWVDIQDSSSPSVVSSIMNLVSGSSGAAAAHKETHWYSESGIIDVFVMLGPQPKDVMRQYTKLTGTTPLPQWFALAYHQCRWNYNDQEDVNQVDSGFDEHDIPYDVMWLDIEHTDGKKYFTWDKSKFPQPLQMVQNLTAKGRKLVTIVDPHMKREANYFFHEDCEKLDFYVKDKDGKVYEGWCWPGAASYPDFFNPAVQDYWASRFALDKYEGTSLDVYTWNDMNEPSVFNGPEVTMPKDCIHHGGWEHRDVHNQYGTMVVEATFKGQLMRSDNKLRPFILSRAFFAGGQRFGAIWTGDNIAEWGHLEISVPMLLSLAVSGFAFAGADVGGFFNNPDSELITRWYQAGAFQPFFRGHAHLHTKRREPWLFDENTKQLIRAAVKRRYSYLPYWYTLFYENEATGVPPMRPLWFEYPQDVESFSVENEYLLGDSLLVHPVVRAGASDVNVYFPGQDTLWYDVDTFQVFSGAAREQIPVTLEKIPVYQRGGSIIAKKERPRRAASLMHNDPYTLIVTLDKAGKAKGRLYIDDGQSFGYRQGQHLDLQLEFDGNNLTSRFLDNGRLETNAFVEKVVIAGLSSAPSKVQAVQGDAAGTTLEFKYNSAQKILTVRKPAVAVAKEWTITLA